jgi:hypothetical protein
MSLESAGFAAAVPARIMIPCVSSRDRFAGPFEWAATTTKARLTEQSGNWTK